jgi:hypothetical protein
MESELVQNVPRQLFVGFVACGSPMMQIVVAATTHHWGKTIVVVLFPIAPSVAPAQSRMGRKAQVGK